MLGILKSLYNEYFGSPTYNVCILGPQESGKTALFNSIKNIHQNNSSSINENNSNNHSIQYIYKPTVGLNVAKYHNGKDRFVIWDLGGKIAIRKIWQNYYSECHGIIYLFNNRLEESMDILKNICTHQEMIKIPVLILVPNPKLKEEIEYILKKQEWINDRNFVCYFILISQYSVKKQTIKQILHWLYLNIKKLHDQTKQ